MITVTNKLQKGFTLIEVLIVLAILAVLLGAVISVLDPVDQLARTRDTARKTTVNDLGKAVQGHYVSRQGVFPAMSNPQGAAGNDDWLTNLQTDGDIRNIPAAVGSLDCSASTTIGDQQNWCYETSGSGNGAQAVVWAKLESKNENSKCPLNAANVRLQAYAVWDSARQNTCLVCKGTAGAESNPATGDACNTQQ